MQIDTTQVKSFFDRLAPTWDSTREANTAAIRRILDAADIVPGVTVLDVACGTGVLFPFYLERQARHITGVDLSEEMIRVAAGKFQDERVTLLAQDVEQLPPGQYDRIVIFNAFPHFPDPRRLLSALAGHLGPGGRLTIAHDRSRHAINGHHQQQASQVSLGLPPAEEVAQLFPEGFHVDTLADSDELYIVSARLNR